MNLCGNETPLTAKDLAPIPQDATVALAARVDLDRGFTHALEIAEHIKPGSGAEVETGLQQAKQALNVDLRGDLVKSLGDNWIVYSAPSEGGLAITGLTAIVSVRDSQKLRHAEEQLLTDAQRMIQQGPDSARGITFNETKSQGGEVIHVVNLAEGAPFSPAWCITEKELIVSLSPQTIKAHLSRAADAASLAEAPAVKRQLADGGATVLAYVDTEALAKLLYPVAEMGYTSLANAAQREGVALSSADFPASTAILPHLRPQVTVIRPSADGIFVQTESTAPTGGVMLAATVPFGMYWMRSATASRAAEAEAHSAAAFIMPDAARKMQSMNNMKQIALAMFNYESTYAKFPAADGSEKTGKPTLSWRVHILPYIEQDALYKEFHLDEPWDSEHNKPLIAKMPTIFAAPGSKAAAEHKTVYLTVRAADTMFPAGKALRMADITDGLSNTIMLVEASDDRAVIWTKPDDYNVDYAKPMAGLVGLRDHSFLIGMADGSVRALSDKVKPANLKAMFTRAGGEIVDFDER